MIFVGLLTVTLVARQPNKRYMRRARRPPIHSKIKNSRDAKPPSIANFLMAGDTSTPALPSQITTYETAGSPLQQVWMKGQLVAEEYDDSPPRISIFFDGFQAISDDEGFFTLPVNAANIEKYSLVITKNLEGFVQGGNTIDRYGVAPHKKYLCYIG